ncbi:MAG: TonB-dependent receptor [Lysobacteraceae bacterium]|nr:MAG: TonB-dependent receptor [Xanthomonadaceae bacterium]
MTSGRWKIPESYSITFQTPSKAPSMPARPHHHRLAVTIALCLALPVHAGDDPQHALHALHALHDKDPKDLAAVEVHATPLADTAENIALPVDVLAGKKLDEAKAGTLGETVAKLPGVQSSNFGPGVGRPIIRGLDGARVQVLSGGLGSGDVSTVSVDHAVSIEPFLAEQIEVLKGPATLLYGSGAIGGAVNVVDGRVPETRVDVPFGGRAEVRHGSVNDETTGMFRLDGGAGAFAFHFDALHRETGDYAIPGFPESAALMAEHGETPDAGEAGMLHNSAVRSESAALGLSWIGARGFIGGAYSLFNTAYGIPGGHEHGEPELEDEPGHAHGEAAVHILMDQRRSELRAGLDEPGPFGSLRLKLADTDYTHTEFEGDAVGTVFHNRSREGRAELVHHPLAGWKGAFGVQASKRDFDAIGEEAFVPGSRSYDTGLFWIGKRAFDTSRGVVQVDLGLRHDDNRIDVDNIATAAPDRHVHTTSASAGLGWKASEALHLSLGLDRAQRAPGAEELYSNGLHVATGSFEFGDATLRAETARRIELGLHLHHGPFEAHLAAWQARYDDFVYLAGTDAEVDGAALRVWRQDDARFHGFEAKLDWEIADTGAGLWSLNLFGDIVRGRLAEAAGGTATQVFDIRHGDHVDQVQARVATGGNLPRIAPARVGGSLRWEREGWRASLGAVRYAKQDHVAAYETATRGYTLLDAHVAWHVDTAGGHEIELFVDGNNLGNREARPHTSFLKDLVPLPGRNLVLGVRAYF